MSALWKEIQPQLGVLMGGESALRQTAKQVASGNPVQTPNPGMSLLDLQDEETPAKSGLSDAEKDELRTMASQAKEKMDRLGKIRKERDDVLRDLKEKIQNDDVSSLLLLNRRSSDVEPQLFASELEKFRPYQGRIGAAVQAANDTLKDLSDMIENVGRGKGVREKQKGQKERQRRVRDWERQLESAGEKYSEVRAGAGKGLSYYESLRIVINDVQREVREYIHRRESERNRMVSDAETRQRIGGGSSSSGLDTSMAGLSLARPPYGSPPPPPQPRSVYVMPTPPAVPTPPAHTSTPYLPPPPSSQPSRASNPYDFSSLSGLSFDSNRQSSQPSYSSPPPSLPSQPSYSSSSQSQSQSQAAYPPPPPARSSSSSYYPPPPTSPHHQMTSPSYPSYQPPPPQSSYKSQQPTYQPPSHPNLSPAAAIHVSTSPANIISTTITAIISTALTADISATATSIIRSISRLQPAAGLAAIPWFI